MRLWDCSLYGGAQNSEDCSLYSGAQNSKGFVFFFAFGESLVLMVVTMAKLDIFSHNFG